MLAESFWDLKTLKKKQFDQHDGNYTYKGT